MGAEGVRVWCGEENACIEQLRDRDTHQRAVYQRPEDEALPNILVRSAKMLHRLAQCNVDYLRKSPGRLLRATKAFPKHASRFDGKHTEWLWPWQQRETDVTLNVISSLMLPAHGNLGICWFGSFYKDRGQFRCYCILDKRRAFRTLANRHGVMRLQASWWCWWLVTMAPIIVQNLCDLLNGAF